MLFNYLKRIALNENRKGPKWIRDYRETIK